MWQIHKSPVLISLQGKQIIQYKELFREKVNGKYQWQVIKKKKFYDYSTIVLQLFMMPLIIQEWEPSCFKTVSKQLDGFFHSVDC